MFDLSSGYSFSKINFSKKTIGVDNYVEHNYSFRGKTGKRYIVIVEEYSYFIFIVKFCLQERKNYPDRFNQLSNFNECSRVLTTIGLIMKGILSKNPYASFGFLGSNLPDENKENTKRFRLYTKVITQVISPVLFEHRTWLKHSAYILLNKDNHEDDLMNKITLMFERIYNV
ncbi:MAG: hypothetical protein ACOYKE_02555 [Ferruginibacter sp.]